MKITVSFNDQVVMNFEDQDFMVRIGEDGQPLLKILKKPIKTKIKHFLGWLFNYCPYGNGCAPKNPIKIESSGVGGGGC